jgi:hypothetical protein
MPAEILSKDDLLQFKTELLSEIRALINAKPEPKKWLKTSEVKKLLKISPGTLQNLRINGTLQYSKIGNTIYYDLEHLQKLLQKNLIKSSQ